MWSPEREDQHLLVDVRVLVSDFIEPPPAVASTLYAACVCR